MIHPNPTPHVHFQQAGEPALITLVGADDQHDEQVMMMCSTFVAWTIGSIGVGIGIGRHPTAVISHLSQDPFPPPLTDEESASASA